MIDLGWEHALIWDGNTRMGGIVFRKRFLNLELKAEWPDQAPSWEIASVLRDLADRLERTDS